MLSDLDLVPNFEEVRETPPGYYIEEDMNEMDTILETVIQRMRTLQEIDDFRTPIDKIVASVLKERTSRVKRSTKGQNEEGQEVAEGRSNDDLVSGSSLLNTLSERSHLSNNPQTVGSYLATIPGILKDQGVTFDSISKHLFDLEKSMENVIESGFSKIADQVKQAGDRIGESGEKNSEILSDIGNFLHQDIDSIKQTIGENGETLHQGLDSIVEKMDYNANIEGTLHDGFHSIAEKLVEDKSKLDDTIHDGLHEISEKIESVNSYGLTGIINSLDSHGHPNLPVVHGNKPIGHECKYHSFNQRPFNTVVLVFRWIWTPLLSF